MITLFEQEFAVKQALRAEAKKSKIQEAAFIYREELGYDAETIIDKIAKRFDISREEVEDYLQPETDT